MSVIPAVAEAIASGQAVRAERLELDSDGVLKRLREEAEADLADIYYPNTRTLRPVSAWPLVWRKGLVAGVKTRELFTGPPNDRVKLGEEVDVRIAPRLPRLKLIGDHTKVGAFVKPDKEGVHETLREFFDAVKNHGGIGPK